MSDFSPHSLLRACVPSSLDSIATIHPLSSPPQDHFSRPRSVRGERRIKTGYSYDSDRVARFKDEKVVGDSKGEAFDGNIPEVLTTRVVGGAWGASARFRGGGGGGETDDAKHARRLREHAARRRKRSAKTVSPHRLRVRRKAKLRAQKLAETLPEWALERLNSRPGTAKSRRSWAAASRSSARRPGTSGSRASRPRTSGSDRRSVRDGSRSRGGERMRGAQKQGSPRRLAPMSSFGVGPRTYSAPPPEGQRPASRARTYELNRGVSTRAPSRMFLTTARRSATSPVRGDGSRHTPLTYRGPRYSPMIGPKSTTRTTVFTYEPGEPVPRMLMSRDGNALHSFQGRVAPIR